MRNLLRRIALAIALLGATLAPAAADTGYFIVHGFNYPQEVVAGPFSSFSACERIKSAYSLDYTYHCDIKAY